MELCYRGHFPDFSASSAQRPRPEAAYRCSEMQASVRTLMQRYAHPASKDRPRQHWDRQGKRHSFGTVMALEALAETPVTKCMPLASCQH